MTATLKDGQVSWSGSRNDEGHREYTIKHYVTAATTDGPAIVMNCPGLPVPGSYWNFDDDVDVWAFITPYMKATILKEKQGDPNRHWVVEQKATTAPSKRCQEESIEDPLLEPDRVSGSFTRFTKEYNRDKDNNLIKYSSHEIIHGPNAEFDASRPTVSIEQNVPDLELDLFSQMIDHVNDAPLWGLAVRCIKLSHAAWIKEYYGTCNVYYTRHLDFEVSYDTFDRYVQDEGTKALNGQNIDGEWVLKPVKLLPSPEMPNPDNPVHFVRYKDKNGENARCILDGAGKPATDLEGSGSGTPPGSILIQAYQEANFLLLGVPTSF